MSLKYILLLLFFFLFQGLFSQNDLESKLPKPLAQMSYEELKDLFYEFKKTSDTITAKNYAKTYLNRAKKDNDTIRIAKGYRLLRLITSNNSIALKYVDSLMHITKNIENIEYPAYNYILKAYLLSKLGKYKESLDYYLKAQPYASKHNNVDHLLIIRQTIGVIKNRWGAYEEALVIYKKHLNYIRKQENYKVKYKKKYFIALYNLSISYINNKKLDSASIYIKEGIKESLVAKDSLMYYKFVMKEGTRLYEKEEYQKALDSLNKAIPHIKEISLAIGHIYAGKVFNEFKDYQKTIFHLKKVDSLFQGTKQLYSELPEAYHLLAEYYKNINDKQNQLIYLEKFLYADSLVKNNMIYLNKTINDKYDKPLLIAEKEKIIKELEKKDASSSKLIIISISIGILFLFSTLLYYLKQQTYKKRLQILLKQDQKEINNLALENTETTTKNDVIDIDKSIIDQALNKLTEFENQQAYLKEGISLNSLSKEFKTNSTYLSKIVNVYKKKNFSNYINDLRVNYAIDRLKSDKKFRLYNIKAIAYEIGFSNPQSFANAFYKKTGIYPSYFLKQLKVE